MKAFLSTLRRHILQKQSLALALFAIVTLATLLDFAPLQRGAALALILLGIQILFEINDKVSETRKVSWYSTFQGALPAISQLIEEKVTRGQVVHVRWVGVTQEAGWPFVQNLFLRELEGEYGRRGALIVELALLDPDGRICQREDGPDKDQIRATREKINRFDRLHAAGLEEHKSSLSLYLYDYRPTWHALMVDDDTLFYSTCMPQNLGFASPQGGTELIVAGSSEQETERVRHFTAWFECIAKESEQPRSTTIA